MSEMARNMGPELESRGIPWRLIAGVGVSTLASAGLVYDQASRRRYWPETDETELRLLDPENVPTEGGDAWVVFSGHGIKDGKEIAESFARHTPDDDPIAYWHFANGGVTLEEMTEELKDFVRPLGSVSIVGHSMGGPVSLESLRLLKNRGEYVPPVKYFPTNCSPFELADARLGLAGRIVTAPNYPGGSLQKAGYIFAMNFINAGSRLPTELVDVWHEAVADAKIQATTGMGAKLWIKQFNLLRHTNLGENPEGFEGIITPDTKAAFFTPTEYRLDRTVRLEESVPKFRNLFAAHGSAMETIHTHSTEHANVEITSEYIGKWLLDREAPNGRTSLD